MTSSEWRPISEAPKDGTVVWVAIHADLYPRVMPNREDLERWNGVQIPVRHPGVYTDKEDGRIWDPGWNVAAPVGHGGFPDRWFSGWQPLPPPPRQ